MNHHLLFFRAGGRIREYRRHLHTRRAYCLLAVVTYTNSLLFSWMMFRQYELAMDLLFCIASCLIGVSVTGLYLNKPLIMVPDVVFKIVLATCAFFFAVKESDEGKEGSINVLLFVLIGYGLQFYEARVLISLYNPFQNYFLFNAIVHLYRRIPVQPPPSYNFFTVTAPPKGLSKQKSVEATSRDVECGEGPSSCEHNESVHTPPPSYAIALALMARKMAASNEEAKKKTITMPSVSEEEAQSPSERAQERQMETPVQSSSLP